MSQAEKDGTGSESDQGQGWGQAVKPRILSLPDVKPGPAAGRGASDRGRLRTREPSPWTRARPNPSKTVPFSLRANKKTEGPSCGKSGPLPGGQSPVFLTLKTCAGCHSATCHRAPLSAQHLSHHSPKCHDAAPTASL